MGLLLTASDVLAEDHQGMTALMWAARKGSSACVELLLASSNAEERMLNGKSAGDMARAQGHAELGSLIDAWGLARKERQALEAESSVASKMKKTSSLRV